MYPSNLLFGNSHLGSWSPKVPQALNENLNATFSFAGVEIHFCAAPFLFQVLGEGGRERHSALSETSGVAHLWLLGLFYGFRLWGSL